MPHITANGIEIYYELHGPEDGEVLVLSNGILMSTASWAMQQPDFSRCYRLLTYDCRGMWQSEHPAGPYSMEQHADDLAALLDALGIPRAHIAGISYGAELSLIFARKYPRKTQSLVVSSAVSEVDAGLRAMIEPWLIAARRHDPDLLFAVTAPVNFSSSWSAAHAPLLEAARKRYETLDFDAFLNLLESFNALDITAQLKEIKAPTLVIVGENDLLKPRRYAEIIAREIPGVELAILPHCAHAASWEQAGLWNTLTLGFIRKHAMSS